MTDERLKPVELLALASIEHGRREERARIARILGSFPLSACVCESAWKSLGYHALDCQREAEAVFRKRLIEAVFTAVSEPSVVDGGGSVHGQPTEAGSGGSKTVAETVA